MSSNNIDSLLEDKKDQLVDAINEIDHTAVDQELDEVEQLVDNYHNAVHELRRERDITRSHASDLYDQMIRTVEGHQGREEDLYKQLREIGDEYDIEDFPPRKEFPYGYGIFNHIWDGAKHLYRKANGNSQPNYPTGTITPKGPGINRRKFLGVSRDALLLGVTGAAASSARQSRKSNEKLDRIDDGSGNGNGVATPDTPETEEPYKRMLTDDDFDSVYAELSTNDRSRIKMDKDNYDIFRDDIEHVEVEVVPGAPSEDSGIKYVLDDREDLGWIRFDDELAEYIADRGEPYE